MIKYYSFLLGPEKSKRNDWMRLDLKIPATNVKEALFIYFAARDYRRNQKDVGKSPDHDTYYAPTIGNIVHEIKRVIEYERVYNPKYGYTQHTFKQIRYYSFHTVLAMYDGYKVGDFV